MPSSNSSSSSSTSQTTNAINPVVIADNGGFSSSAVVGGNLDQTINNTTLDGDVAMRAMDNTLTATQDALLFGSDAMRQSYTFSTGVNQQAFSFANSANSAASSAQSAALGSAQSSMNRAFEFGANQTGVALDSLSQSANMIKDAYADAKGRGALTDWMLMGAIGLAGVVAIFAIMGRKK